MLCNGTLATPRTRSGSAPRGTLRHGWIRAATSRDSTGATAHVIYHVIDVSEQHGARLELERLALTGSVIRAGNRTRFEQEALAALSESTTPRFPSA